MPSPGVFWLAAGLIIIALEILVPGFVIFWFGIGAIITSVFVFLGLQADSSAAWLIFFGSSFALLLFWHIVLKKYFGKKVTDDTRDPTLNNLRGRAKTPIEQHKTGEVELYSMFHGLKDWKAESDEFIGEGDEIEVIEARGIRLLVKKTDGGR